MQDQIESQNQELQDQRRRQYPKDLQGGKNHWKGMIHHQNEYHKGLQQIEKEVQLNNKYELQQDYEEKLQKKLEEKKQQQLLAIQDQQMIDQKIQEFKEEKLKGLGDLRLKQNYMANNYNQSVEIKKSLQEQERINKLHYEEALIRFNREQLENEQRLQREKKDLMARDAQIQLEIAKQKQEQLKQNELEFRNQHIQLMQQNARKEYIKEENYRNFYQQCGEVQQQNQILYKNQVLDNLFQKQQQMQQLIDKNVDEYQRKKYQEELDRLKMRYDQLLNVKQTNQSQMNQHLTQKQYEMELKRQQQEERMKDQAQYQEYIQYKKQEKSNQQLSYKDFLDKQKQEQEEKRLQQNKMNQIEKKFNYWDLQAFKNQNQELHSMIPGWSPQVGAKSNRVYNNKSTLLTGQDQSQNKIPTEQQSQQKEDTLKKVAVDSLANIMASQSQKSPIYQINPYNYGHNPITNPIPHNIQNPYIARELTQVAAYSSKNNIFQQNANRNIIV